MNFLDPTWSLTPPREWQAEAFNIIARHYISSTTGHRTLVAAPPPGMIRAIMGAGKSILIAEAAACLQHSERNPIVITTSSQLLVRQLRDTVMARVKGSKSVGCYFADKKESGCGIIICCTPSAAKLAEELASRNRKCSLWIADEAHKTECATMIAALEKLKPDACLGFTATPFRAGHDERITLFSELLYDYGPSQALKDGVVVPWKIESWNDEETELDDACLSMIRSADGPGIVNACSIEDAEEFAKKLNDSGIRSSALHSRTKLSNQKFIIESLKDGALRCVVHVAMLVEGADYPWLRWMCLRRNVDSRVRFLQEIGRALRSYPGKSVATFYDPNDLFGLHRITYEAALGAEPTEEDLIDEILELPPERMAQEIEKLDEAVALKTYEMELRRLVVACDASGMCPERAITRKADRLKPSNKIQQVMCLKYGSIADQFIIENWKRFFDLVIERGKSLSYGAAADLCCILASISNARKFPPLDSSGRITAAIGATIEETAPVEIFSPEITADTGTTKPGKWAQMELEFK